MNGGRFENPWSPDDHSIHEILLWKLGLRHKETGRFPEAPDAPAERVPLPSSLIYTPPDRGWRVAWLGHSSFLLQGVGLSLLIDPVFAAHCSPIPLPALRRTVEPPCGIDTLPRIDAVLLTHSHYDHCDLETLRTVGLEVPLIVPEGHANWLSRRGFVDVREVPWNKCIMLGDRVAITSTPARHFTARSPFDRNRGHWCGWILNDGANRIWHAGDSAWCPAFGEIGRLHGPLDFGMIPIGAYQPRAIMRSVHMNPVEAVEAFLESGCRRAVAMHWGTFRLTDEALGEPPVWLRHALRARGVSENRFEVWPVGGNTLVGG